MDLVEPIQTESPKSKRCIYIVVSDFSGFTWVDFLRDLPDVYERFTFLYKISTIEKHLDGTKIVKNGSDHGKEFENDSFTNLCEKVVSPLIFSPKPLELNSPYRK